MQTLVRPCNCTLSIDFQVEYLPIQLFSDRTVSGFVSTKVRTLRATFLLYHSGKAVCVGAKTPSIALKETENLLNCMITTLSDFPEYTELRSKLESRVGGNFKVTVCNVVACGSYNQAVSLPDVYRKLQSVLPGTNAVLSYEPERFAGLTVNFGRGSGTVILFPSGKVNITGCKDIKEAEDYLTQFNIWLTGNPSDSIRHTQPPVIPLLLVPQTV